MDPGAPPHAHVAVVDVAGLDDEEAEPEKLTPQRPQGRGVGALEVAAVHKVCCISSPLAPPPPLTRAGEGPGEDGLNP